MFKRKENKPAAIQTLVGAKTRISGDVEFAGGLHLDGQINGNVTAGAGAMLSISEQGCVEGSVAVPNIVLNGVVKGDIDSSERIKLGPKARVHGNVSYLVIETAVGAQINGKLIHRSTGEAPAGEPRLLEPPPL